jgi:hypothetical protein
MRYLGEPAKLDDLAKILAKPDRNIISKNELVNRCNNKLNEADYSTMKHRELTTRRKSDSLEELENALIFSHDLINEKNMLLLKKPK